jgi:hypothetical protein
MKKVFIIGLFLITAILADNSLGTPINDNRIRPNKKIKSYNKNIENPPIQQRSSTHKKFKKDHHRYDKRYNNFDYEREGYYSNNDYYYGYYDNRGYFYNNIFFTYNSRYTYHDRHYHLGYFRPSYQHHRVYEYHVINDWNRVHAYREPNQIVYGYYYDRPSYNSYRHYDNRDNSRMNINRNSHYRDSYQQENYYRNNNHRSNSNHYRDNEHKYPAKINHQK